MVEINGSELNGYVDFGSQCSLIQESVANKLIDKNNWKHTELPHLRGFGNSVIQPIGICIANLTIDDINVNVELVIVPDRYLNYEVLVGQTVTEQSHVEVYKNDKQLTIRSKLPLRETRVTLRTIGIVKLIGSASIKICTGNNFTGDVNIENSKRIKYKVKGGKVELNNGMGYVTIENDQGNFVQFKREEIITRGISSIEFLNEPKILNVYKICTEKTIAIGELNIGKDLSEIETVKLINLINEYRDCFATSLAELGCTNITSMDIELKDSTPVVYRPYRLSYTERAEVRSMIDDLLSHGIIRESSSPYASPILMVKKKTGDKRLCVDYRALNRKTDKQHYPIPRIEDQIDRLSGNIYFNALDLASGYYQIPISEESKSKTAFVTPDGQFEFNRMPFGLANAPAVFQKTINMVLGNARFDTALAYMDDILVPSKNFEQGIDRLRVVFEKLRQTGLTLKPQKCYFFQQQVDYLGFEVSGEGVKPGSRKVEAVRNFPTPKDVHNVRQIIGLASFFRRFIKGFAELARPLTKLLKKNAVWIWGEEQERSFEQIKNILSSKPVLALYEPTAETQIHTDASKHGVGGVLMQKQADTTFRPIAYYSRQTSPEESHYSSYELETLAVIASLTKFRAYVLGLNFTVVTDCNSLRATFLKRDMIPRVARWWSLIQEYDCNILYRSGDKMTHVDALSRNPVDDEIGIIEAVEIHDVMSIDIDNDWLVTVQSNDSELKRIKDILSNSEYDGIIDIRKNFILKRDRVYRNTNDGLRWVVPKGCRWQILQKNHDQIGHFGFEKTYDRIKEHYWFARMRKFIKKYVSACLECAHNKVPAGKKEGFLHSIPKIATPFHTIHVDHVGPFVTSKRKNSYILVIVDAYTKFIVLKAVKNTKSSTSITILRDYFGTFGLCVRLISDRGTSFTSSKFKSFILELGIRHIQNAVASPRANGQVERYNRTILDSIAAQNHGCDERLWDDRLLQVQWGLNNTINKGTGKSPSEVLFGLKLTNTNEGHIISEIQSDIISNDGPGQNNVVQLYEVTENSSNSLENNLSNLTDTNRLDGMVDSHSDINNDTHACCVDQPDINSNQRESDDKINEPENRTQIRSEVDQFINKSQEQQKHRFDRKRKEAKKYDIGDLVRVERTSHTVGKSRKLLPKLLGPYKVTKVLGNDRYEVIDTPITKKGRSNYTGVFAVDKIFPWTCFNAKENDITTDSSDGEDSINNDQLSD